MTLENLEGVLELTDLPVSYHEPPDGQASNQAYICYQAVNSNNFYADGIVYCPFTRVRIVLYTPSKEPATEEKLESVLSSLCWTKSEEYIEATKKYQITYELEV